ncbi:MAG: CCA tRNA nucleotidyltransferase [Candidatus Aenigmatarchaeota archaeon]|nr:MAG: CCA tRNA nucleotidyltransferase [Candidatus Aenigmarchaeota archaeon]
MDKVLFAVLKKITPSKTQEKEMESIKEKILSAADSVIKPLNLSRTLAGSLMRNTWLPDKKEIDVFIEFPKEISRDDLEKQGLEIGKKIVKKLKGKHIIAYAEHPYVRGFVNGFWVDIVPCYKLENAREIKSSVDRTPFHNEWLSEKFKKEYIPETRLLKRFLKGIGIYGSDAKTLGFSGYLCELLIVHYKTFKNFVKKCSKWKPGKVFIDLEGYYKSMPEKFLNSPLVVIDPVDPNRNVAAAVSALNFTKLVISCENFLGKPSIRFFFPKTRKPDVKKIENKIKERETGFIAILFKTPNIVEDTLWPQLRKTAKRIANVFKEYDFDVMGYDIWSGQKESVLVFELQSLRLPKIKKLIGPRVFSEKHSKQFITKYKKTGKLWIEGENWTAEIYRKIQTAEEVIKVFLSNSEKGLREKGIASYIAKSISKGFNIMKQKEIIDFAKKNSDFSMFLKEYLERNLFCSS